MKKHTLHPTSRKAHTFAAHLCRFSRPLVTALMLIALLTGCAENFVSPDLQTDAAQTALSHVAEDIATLADGQPHDASRVADILDEMSQELGVDLATASAPSARQAVTTSGWMPAYHMYYLPGGGRYVDEGFVYVHGQVELGFVQGDVNGQTRLVREKKIEISTGTGRGHGQLTITLEDGAWDGIFEGTYTEENLFQGYMYLQGQGSQHGKTFIGIMTEEAYPLPQAAAPPAEAAAKSSVPLPTNVLTLTGYIYDFAGRLP